MVTEILAEDHVNWRIIHVRDTFFDSVQLLRAGFPTVEPGKCLERENFRGNDKEKSLQGEGEGGTCSTNKIFSGIIFCYTLFNFVTPPPRHR